MSSTNSTSSPGYYLTLQTTCHAYIPNVHPSYGYVPSRTAGIIFVVLFALSATTHVVQATMARRWWCLAFAIGALAEMIGWIGRLVSSQCPYLKTAFLMQISTLIFAPAFYAAGIYVILGRLITLYLPLKTSLLKPNSYLWIFCSCDFFSLLLQAIGGGLASSEADTIPPDTHLGTSIMVSGIVFQMASMAVFTGFASEFLIRVTKATRGQRESTPYSDIEVEDNTGLRSKMMYLLYAMAFSILCILIRSVYRTIELLQGWTGYLITHEPYFIGLDATLMILAVVVFNFVHPGWFLPRSGTQVAEKSSATHSEGVRTQQVETSTSVLEG